jgi:cell division GTPase FtsZ
MKNNGNPTDFQATDHLKKLLDALKIDAEKKAHLKEIFMPARPGVEAISLHPEDLRRFLTQRGRKFVGITESKGDRPIEEALFALLKKSPIALNATGKAAYAIVHLHKHPQNPHAPLLALMDGCTDLFIHEKGIAIFGMSEDPSFAKDQIRVTIMLAIPQK